MTHCCKRPIVLKNRKKEKGKKRNLGTHAVCVPYFPEIQLLLRMVGFVQAQVTDTNGEVSGALLGCKLGVKCFPETRLDGLCHKKWLDGHIKKLVGVSFFLGYNI